jgi:hypothetical protein
MHTHRSEPSLSPADMAVAEAWLRRLGYQVRHGIGRAVMSWRWRSAVAVRTRLRPERCCTTVWRNTTVLLSVAGLGNRRRGMQ